MKEKNIYSPEYYEFNKIQHLLDLLSSVCNKRGRFANDTSGFRLLSAVRDHNGNRAITFSTMFKATTDLGNVFKVADLVRAAFELYANPSGREDIWAAYPANTVAISRRTDDIIVADMTIKLSLESSYLIDDEDMYDFAFDSVLGLVHYSATKPYKKDWLNIAAFDIRVAVWKALFRPMLPSLEDDDSDMMEMFDDCIGTENYSDVYKTFIEGSEIELSTIEQFYRKQIHQMASQVVLAAIRNNGKLHEAQKRVLNSTMTQAKGLRVKWSELNIPRLPAIEEEVDMHINHALEILQTLSDETRYSLAVGAPFETA